MPYGALIKLVPAHWSKGDDLNKNTRSCWYRPGFRWSPESGQSVIPKDLEKFEVIVLKFQWTNTLNKILKTNDEACTDITWQCRWFTFARVFASVLRESANGLTLPWMMLRYRYCLATPSQDSFYREKGPGYRNEVICLVPRPEFSTSYPESSLPLISGLITNALLDYPYIF